MNSGSSSRSRTPRWARLASPGRGPGPPPTIAAVEAEWCGARNGGSAISGRPGSTSPATEWIRVTSSASSGASGGRTPGSRRASIVLPVPGGPARSRLCAPAAAISSARRARSWPRTSARSGCGRRDGSVRRRRVRRRLTLAAQVGDRLGQVAQRHGVDPGELGLGRRLGRAEQSREPGPAGALGRREHAADRTHTPVERELTERRMAGERSGGDLPRRRQDRERDRQVEAGALLAQARRREVDGDAPDGPLELGRGDADADALLRLLAGPVGQADDREAGNAELEMRLDLDATRLEADERVRDRPREHGSTVARDV